MEENKEIAAVEQVLIKSGLSESRQNGITNALSSFFEKATEWNATIQSIVITSPDEVGKMKMAKEGRLTLKRMRGEAKRIVSEKRAEVKDRMQDDLLEDKLWLKAGQMIEATFESLEAKLEEKEKFAERYEAERIAELEAKRIVVLSPFAEFVPLGLKLGELTDEDFEKLVNGAKLQKEAQEKQAKIEEENRIAQAKIESDKREDQRLENERLKKEAEENEKIRQAERAENERIQAEAKKESEKLQAENDAKLKSERESKAKLEAELEANRNAEAEKKRQEQAKLEKEASKGDHDKMLDLIKDLESVQTKYKFESTEYKVLQNSIIGLLEKVIKYTKDKIK